MAPELFVVPRSQVFAAWPEIERWILRIENPTWTLLDVKTDLADGKAQAWGLRNTSVLGFWITRIENTRSHRYGLVWITAGEALQEGIAIYNAVIEPWFWEQGCEWIEIVGRKGWKRVMPGYDEAAVMLRKYRHAQ